MEKNVTDNDAGELFSNPESNLPTNIVHLKDIICSQEYTDLHDAVKINGELYTKLRNVMSDFSEAYCKSKLGMKVGYTSFTSFYKGKDAELKATGLNNIAQTCGYNLMIVPIPDSIPTDQFKLLTNMVENFVADVDKTLNTEGNKSKNKTKQPTTSAQSLPKVNNALLNTIKQQSSGENQTIIGDLDKNTTSDVIKNIGADEFNLNDMMGSIETANNSIDNAVDNTAQNTPETPNLDILSQPNNMDSIIDDNEDADVASITGLNSISGFGDIDESFLDKTQLNIIDK